MNSKNKMRVSALQLAFSLNELEKKKKFYFLESICEYMLKNFNYFQKGTILLRYDVFRDRIMNTFFSYSR